MLQRPSFRKEHGTPCQQAAVASLASSASSGGFPASTCTPQPVSAAICMASALVITTAMWQQWSQPCRHADSGSACSVTASAARRSHMILCALVPDRMAWVSKRSRAAPSRPTLAILLSMRCSRPFEAPGFAYSQDTFLPFGNQLVEVCPPPPQGIQADQHVIADRHVNRPKIEQIEGEGLPVEG